LSRRVACLFLALALLAPACDSSDGSDPQGGGGADIPQGAASPVDINTAPPPKGDWLESACALPKEHLVRIARGIFPGRSPEITMVPREPNFFGSFTANSHSGPWDYVQRVPVVLWGPGYVKQQGQVRPQKEVRNLDIVATIAELLGQELPPDRPGRPLTEALLPESKRATPPKLVVTIVWDGGGDNVLQQWPRSWPNLKRLMSEGTSFSGSVVGSSPPVTPASHASVGTGAFPDQHGIVDIPLRINGEMDGSWPNKSPKHLVIPAFGDLYDQSTDNAAQVAMVADHNWHLGMIGHGSYIEGGDKDYGVILNDADGLTTNPNYYTLPPYLKDVPGWEDDVREIDASDGEVDDRWMGNDVLAEEHLARETPAMTLYQTRIIRALVEREGFGSDDIGDLLFVNYKQIDYVGHRYNMVEPEMESVLKYTDQELGELVTFFNDAVGEDNWVLTMTADHGSTPAAISTRAWPIGMESLINSVAEHFETSPDQLFDDQRVTGLWTNQDGLESLGITTEELSDFMLGQRIEDNAVAVDELPEGYGERLDEPIFSAVFPTDQIDRILDCAGVEA
jgi:Type I phosphodiesterase / nucleotide pyrophosphatase